MGRGSGGGDQLPFFYLGGIWIWACWFCSSVPWIPSCCSIIFCPNSITCWLCKCCSLMTRRDWSFSQSGPTIPHGVGIPSWTLFLSAWYTKISLLADSLLVKVNFFCWVSNEVIFSWISLSSFNNSVNSGFPFNKYSLPLFL